MSSKQLITILPYYKVKNNGADDMRKVMNDGVEIVHANEPGCLFFSFIVNGNEVFVREGYASADAVKKHMVNCGALAVKFLESADLVKCEMHGPKKELDQLGETLQVFNPAYWYEEGLVHLQ
ncbi:hypothetical protein SARC_07947 [Sphaeroforma arctica JP610]|uniref:ABM domain-containing protein n=1 Tax=Sphaeroforma arctica JP610 TaxID=667725 RepID=A0A0L0FS91_9EUKA|nr:hypothetical protein SARC_07947 [Sphaeroforma arctica JP610]KNC79667.1 hypothetical protein SARC_07947 [Sphaeroforma arctica JP610]|eukprot:XP_014153569.1 hypothetical protein SARC_07947 [Sphaeroforma arctica JP610]